ncbi:AAA family ATPase [Cellulomonas hominis]
MDPVANPYTPNAGARPDALVGRDDQLGTFDLLLRRLARGRTEQSMIITGLRGVGKTVLLGQFREKALAQDWSVLDYEVVKHDDRAFRRDIALRLRTTLLQLAPRARWNDRFRRAAAALSSFTLSVDESGQFQAGLNVDAIEGLADHAFRGVVVVPEVQEPAGVNVLKRRLTTLIRVQRRARGPGWWRAKASTLSSGWTSSTASPTDARR